MQPRYRYSILGIAMLLFAIATYKMFSLPLWSWWTCLLLASGWSIWLMIALPIYIKDSKSIRWLALSSASGLFLALGFPPYEWLTPLIFIGFVPLLRVIDEITASNLLNKKRLVMRFAYNTFVIWNIGATWWVENAGLIAGLIANLLNAFFMCLPVLGYYITQKKVSKPLAYLSFIAYWFSWEYLHLNWDLSWPWLTIGNALASHPLWIQWYEYTGVFGGGLWILVTNFMVFEIYKNRQFTFSVEKKLFKKDILKLVTIFSFPLFFSFLILFFNKNINEVEKNQLEVVSLQPNFEPHYEKFDTPDNLQLKRFLELSYREISPTTRYLILPETSFGTYDVDILDQYEPIQAFQNMVDSFPNLHIVGGFDLLKNYIPLPNPNLPNTVRKRNNRWYEIYNGSLQFATHQSKIPYYKKSKLVPGPEVLPFRFIFGHLDVLFKKMGGTVEGLGRQKERSLFFDEMGNGIAPVICYESIYGDYCGDYIRHGAKAIFIMTNDGWWDDTPGYQQHLAFASLRAIEFRRFVVRSANTGTSAFINTKGEIVANTNYNETAALKNTIVLNDKITFYAKYGDFIARIAIFISFILILWIIYKNFQRHNP